MISPRCGANICLACEAEELERREAFEKFGRCIRGFVDVTREMARAFYEASSSFRGLVEAQEKVYAR